MENRDTTTTQRNTKHRFRGIITDAAVLGIRRESLWLALTGHRSHPSALGRYYLLVAAREIHSGSTVPPVASEGNTEVRDQN